MSLKSYKKWVRLGRFFDEGDNLKFIIAATLLLSLNSFAVGHRLQSDVDGDHFHSHTEHEHCKPTETGYHCQFAPPNNMNIPVNAGKSLNYAEYTQALNMFEALFSPIVRRYGKKLHINRLWHDGTVNAYATSDEYTFYINMFGGLARHPYLTLDGFIMVACHELGHHIGGAPQKGWRQVSNEGQSDYFAAHRCMREILWNLDNDTYMNYMQLDREVVMACHKRYRSFADVRHYQVCVRTGMAGLSLANMLANLRGVTTLPRVSTKDRTVVEATDDSHPNAQCRLDTYMAGALCFDALHQYPTFETPNYAACLRNRFNQLKGSRPLCWYKP